MGAAVAVFVVACVLPLAYLFVDLLRRLPDAYSASLLDARRRGLLYTTTELGVGTAIVATAIGVPLGIVLSRVPLRRKTILRIALAVPALSRPTSSAWRGCTSEAAAGWLPRLSVATCSPAGPTVFRQLFWYWL